MLLATARFVITTIQGKFSYFFVFFFPKVPRSIDQATEGYKMAAHLYRLSTAETCVDSYGTFGGLIFTPTTGFSSGK